jgi:hypothetical protein
VGPVQHQPLECLEARKQASHSSAHQQPRQLLNLEVCSAQPLLHNLKQEAYSALLLRNHRVGDCLDLLLQHLNLKLEGYLGQLPLHLNQKLGAYLDRLLRHLNQLKLADCLAQLRQLRNHRLAVFSDPPLNRVVDSLGTRTPLKLRQAAGCSRILELARYQIIARVYSETPPLNQLKVVAFLGKKTLNLFFRC